MKGLSNRIGVSVRELREHLGMTQQDLSAAADLSKSAVGLIESGRRCPSIDSLARIAIALGLKPSQLIALAEADEAHTEFRQSLDTARRAAIKQAVAVLAKLE